MDENFFDTWATRHGVERPFAALADMEPEVRKEFAKQLGVSLDDWWSAAAWCLASEPGVDDDIEAVFQADAEACIIINADHKGLQARSHSALRTFNIFADNHNWRQVLESVRLGRFCWIRVSGDCAASGSAGRVPSTRGEIA